MENQIQQKRPDVFSYINYRKYLKDYYSYLKSTNKKYSYRYIAQQVGSSSPSWLADIINGRINLTENFLFQCVNFLHLSSREKDFFKLLVAYDQSGSQLQKKELLDSILSTESIKMDTITKCKFDYFRKWYIPVVRELLLFIKLKESDNKILATLITPAISPKEAREALCTLKNLELVKLDPDGYLLPINRLIRKDSTIPSGLIPAYHLENLRLAGEAQQRFSKEERDISSITFNLSDEIYIQANEEIKKFREKLLYLSECSTGNKRVYQCNLQLFPVSQKGPSCGT